MKVDLLLASDRFAVRAQMFSVLMHLALPGPEKGPDAEIPTGQTSLLASPDIGAPGALTFLMERVRVTRREDGAVIEIERCYWDHSLSEEELKAGRVVAHLAERPIVQVQARRLDGEAPGSIARSRGLFRICWLGASGAGSGARRRAGR